MSEKYVEVATAAEIINQYTGIETYKLMDIMVEIPAVNVEKVVRCKECIYGVLANNAKRYMCIKDNIYRMPDYFCANGKQKGNDNNV